MPVVPGVNQGAYDRRTQPARISASVGARALEDFVDLAPSVRWVQNAGLAGELRYASNGTHLREQ